MTLNSSGASPWSQTSATYWPKWFWWKESIWITKRISCQSPKCTPFPKIQSYLQVFNSKTCSYPNRYKKRLSSFDRVHPWPNSKRHHRSQASSKRMVIPREFQSRKTCPWLKWDKAYKNWRECRNKGKMWVMFWKRMPHQSKRGNQRSLSSKKLLSSFW